MRAVSSNGLILVKRFEGIKDGDPTTVNLDPYMDDVGVWTIGWGHAIVDPINNRMLRGEKDASRAHELYPDGLTTSQADDLVRADLLDASRDVSAFVKVPLTDNQFDALVSFHFNTGALHGSTLLAQLNVGDYVGAASQFVRWNKGKVKGVLVPLPGLTTRREQERKLFLTEEKA